MSSFYHAFFYDPLYNGLVFLIDILPNWADAGIAVIIFTVIVKLILYPLSKKAVFTQIKMKQCEGELAKIKEKYKTDREGQARAVMNFYKEKGLNPFSSFFLILIQLPIIIGLYYIFYKGLPVVDVSLLYPFIKAPDVNMHFLGLIDIGSKSIPLAVLAGVTQFFQIKFSMPPPQARAGEASFKEDMMRSMHFQMRYLLPIFVIFISYSISGVVALYWTTSNLFAIGQELYVRRRMRLETSLEVAPRSKS